MSSRDRHQRSFAVQATEGVGIVVLLAAGIWAVAAMVALVVSLLF